MINSMEDKSINIQHIAGVVDTYEVARLKRLIFRSTKGKSYMFIQDFKDEDDELETSPKSKRSVYIIVFWDGNHIRDKIQKICDSFSGQRYDIPEMNSIGSQIEKVKQSIHDAKSVF